MKPNLHPENSACGYRPIVFTAFAAALLFPQVANTQTEDDEDIFWLDPFEVTNVADTTYQRSSAATATRIAMDLVETPLSIQVVSTEFLRDTGRDTLVDAFAYTSSVDTSPDDVLRNDAIRVRGFRVSFVLRDGFKKYYDAPLDAIDRVEVVKGPNAVFFGQSQPGGVINYITENPLFDPAYEFRVEYGDNQDLKVRADATGPIGTKKNFAAYRVITSYRDSESWRDNTSWRNDYVFTAFTIRPFERVSLTTKYEYYDGFQTGGVNSALIGNRDYLNDYYANDGRDYGYGVNWAQTGLNPRITLINDVFPEKLRYPWPNPIPGSGFVQPPATGFGGINPRWDGTVTPELLAFYGGTLPAELQNWTQPDQSAFPEYQRNVNLPFQYPIIDLESQGEGAGFRPGWRMLKFFESGMTEFPGRVTGPVFPRGFNWNPNGLNSFHDTEHHIVTAELRVGIFSWLNFRYAGNYLENTFLRVQQHNSDPAMDGYTLSPGQGYRFGAGAVAGASVNKFSNKRYTHQADFTTDFEIGSSSHTFLLSAELREDEFVEFNVPSTDYYVQNALRPHRLRPDGAVRQYTYQEGVSMLDIFSDPEPLIGLWSDPSLATPGGSTNYQEEMAIAFSWRGSFFNNKLFTLAGVRWEEREDFNFDGTTVSGSKGKVDGTTPMFGINYVINPGLTAYASYSESFVPPGRPQGRSSVTFYEGPVGNPTPVTVPLETIGVETGVGYEAGFKASGFNGRLSGTVSVFHLERQNIVVTDNNLIAELRQNYLSYGIDDWDVSLESGSTAPRTNSGTEISEGVELDVIYEVMPNWTLTGSFSYLWKRELSNPDVVEFFGNPRLPIGSSRQAPYPHASLFSDVVHGTYTLPSTGEVITIYRPLTPNEISAAIDAGIVSGAAPVNPYTGQELVFEPILHRELAQVSELRFSLWSKYTFTEGRFEGVTVGFGGNYQSKQRPQQTRDLNYWNPGFWSFDAMVQYPISLGWADLTVQLNVNNVFDKRAIASGSFGINAPREWQLSASLRF